MCGAENDWVLSTLVTSSFFSSSKSAKAHAQVKDRLTYYSVFTYVSDRPWDNNS